MIYQGHRGDRLHYPENTFPSYYGAIRAGYSFIELDNKFTKDNVCVLIHDHDVRRTGRNPDGSEISKPLAVADLTFDEIRTLDFGIARGEEFRGTKIPSLAELLDFIRETKIPVKFDNVLQSFSREQIISVLDAVKNSGVEELVGFTAMDVAFVRFVTSRLDKCIIHYDGPTSKEIYEELAPAAKGHRLFIWLPSEPKSWLTYPVATREDVLLAKQYGEVGLWTAHDQASLEYIISLKPDAMELEDEITPAIAEAALKQSV